MNRKIVDESEICELYLHGKSFTDIKKEIGVSQSSARRILVCNGIEIRSKSVPRSKLKCCSLDLNFFKKIDSHEKAYWLGVIVSDGTIQKDGYKVSLTSKNIDLIRKFKKAIKSSHKITPINSFDKRTKKTYSRFIIQIGSKDLVSDIIKLGITNKKSYTCEFPKIEEKYYLSFLRGLFDGDGSLTVKSKENYRMSFTATREIINFIQIFLKEKHNIEPHPIYVTSTNMNVCRTHYFSDTKKILSLLYENSNKNSRLNRKYKLYIYG